MSKHQAMNTAGVSSTSLKSVKPRSLLLKHEILSPECDIFRVCLPRRLFLRRLGRLMGFVLVMGAGHWWMRVEKLAVSALMVLVTLSVVIYALSQSIEERILFIRGLGVQYSVLNGFNQETTTFHPFEQIKSFYIFESFDGLKIGHFFSIKLQSSSSSGDEDKDDDGTNCVVLFENMRPPIEFLKRVYRKFIEVTAENI